MRPNLRKNDKCWTRFRRWAVIRTELVEKTAEIGEEELAARCAKGEQSARRELYIRYAARLNALCSRYSDGPAEGMDLMHDAMCKVFDTIGRYQYRGDGSLYAWISRVAVHLAIDRMRKEKKLSIVSTGDDLPDVEAPEPTEIDRIPASVLQGFISSLPTAKRLIFNMFCVDELSHQEIARQLGITEGASRSTLSKAKKALADMVKDYMKK